jgi:type I restriction enzyme R subunit
MLHDDQDRRAFDSVVVVTDRRALDRQLRRTVKGFAHTEGVLEAVDKGSAQLAEALEKGRDIITTTLQKFPYVIGKVGALPGARFAVIIDEAHSSQNGEASANLKKVLDTSDLDAAELDELGPNPFASMLDEDEDEDDSPGGPGSGPTAQPKVA